MTATFKQIIIYFLIAMSLTDISAQDEDLYFIMAYLDNFTRSKYEAESTQEFHKVLYKLKEDTLIALDTLNYRERTNLETFLHFPEYKIFYIEEKDMYDYKNPNLFTILDYSNKRIIKRKYNSNLDSLFNTYKQFKTCIGKSDNIYISSDYISGSDGIIKRFYFDKKFNRKSLNLEHLKNVYMPGTAGMQYRTSFYFKLYDNLTDPLRIPKLKDVDNMPKSKYQPPNNFYNILPKKLFLRINNNRFFGLMASMEKRDFFKDSLSLILLYDKKLNFWDTLRIPGTSGCFANEGNILYGTMANTISSLIQDKESKYDSLYNQIYLDKYSRYNTGNGLLPDLVGYFGVLFLINTNDKQIFKWRTNNIDSEILSIIDEVLYYRVFDELHSVRLSESGAGLDFSTDKILIKNSKIVPFIHWMFSGNFAQEVEVKYIYDN